MKCTYRYNLKDSLLSQHVKRDPLRASHINFLNTNELARSLVKTKGQNSQRSSLEDKKINYKYERINNSFRLVQIEPIESQNKQNYCEFSRNSIEQKNNNIILTLNSICERVDNLENHIKLDEEGLQAQVSKIVERLFGQKSEAKKCMPTETGKIMNEIEEIKQKIKKYDILPEYIADSEQHILKKCKGIMEEKLGERTKRDHSIQNNLRIQSKTLLTNEKNEMEQMKKEMESMMFKIEKKLQNYIESQGKLLSNQNIAVISDFIYSKAQFENQLTKINEKLKNLKSNETKNQKQKTVQRKKCQKQIIGNLMLEFHLKPIERQIKNDNLDNLDSIIYGIDPDGYLVDYEGYYIVDSKKETIKLTVSQINRLHEAGLTSKINS